jgi:preprotein translocase subunit SecD
MPRRRRALVVSLVAVLLISFGALTATLLAGWTPKLGLDLAGGTELVITPSKGTISPSQQNEAVTIIQERVNGFGVSGATVQTQGSQIIVQIPGVKNGAKLDKELVTLAQLYFRPVLCFAPAYVGPKNLSKQQELAAKLPPLGANTCSASTLLTEALIDVQVEPSSPQGYVSNPDIGAYGPLESYPSVEAGLNSASSYEVEPILGAGGNNGPPRALVGPSLLSGTAIASASAVQNSVGAWEVDCTLTSSGSAKWDAITSTYFHRYLAIDLDGIVQSAPLIQPTQVSPSSFDGQVAISGGASFTQSYANTLATALNYGSLPVALKILTEETVSPTLGHSALIAGLGAGLAGLVLVLFYVIGYYRMLGLVVITGLAVTAAILWALISALGRTSVAPSFDLAGVTGVIVSIGITVDSYIVYFERLKDETRAGRSVRTSLERGFASAWRTVLAADTVSFLAAVLLYFLAVGSVQGFAFFLGLSTLLDVIVTWFFTRPAVGLLGRNEALTSMRRIGIARGLSSAGAPA